MLLTFAIIFLFIWTVGVGAGITFSGFIHIFLFAAAMLLLAHCWLPARLGPVAQSSSDPLHQRRLARLLRWRPTRRNP